MKRRGVASAAMERRKYALFFLKQKRGDSKSAAMERRKYAFFKQKRGDFKKSPGLSHISRGISLRPNEVPQDPPRPGAVAPPGHGWGQSPGEGAPPPALSVAVIVPVRVR